MKNNIENGIYIPDENRELHPLDEWTKREDPTTAQTVVPVTDSGMLEIANEDLPGKFNFKVAQKAAVELAEQEAEERMRQKAAKAYCHDCCCTVVGKCGIGSENCIALRDFIQKLNEA